MVTTIHRANSRGHANHGWLNSYHTFSFANYQNPERMNFGALRVLNDDTVAPGAGFGMHPHQNMEIISIPISGVLTHKDSTGSIGHIVRGDIQIMSAGTGIRHSEYNGSTTEDVQFLQIWVLPKKVDIVPQYGELSYTLTKNEFNTLISPEKSKNTLWINQDAYFSLADIDTGTVIDYTLHKKGNLIYVFVIEGSIEIEGEQLNRRDAIGIQNIEKSSIKTFANAEVLIIEVPNR